MPKALKESLKKKPSILLFGLIAIACNAPSRPEQVSNAAIPTVSTALCDGMDWSSDTLFTSPEQSFIYEPLRGAGGGFSQKIAWRNGFIEIIAAADSPQGTLALFQTDALLRWTQVYCRPLEDAMSYDTHMPDLNFDGHKDLLIDAHSGGNFGKSSICFLFHPQSQTFQRNMALDLENMSIDTRTKRLRSRHYSSIYGGNCKWLYGWKADFLVLFGAAVYHAEVDSATITLKTRQKNGSLKPTFFEGEKDAV